MFRFNRVPIFLTVQTGERPIERLGVGLDYHALKPLRFAHHLIRTPVHGIVIYRDCNNIDGAVPSPPAWKLVATTGEQQRQFAHLKVAATKANLKAKENSETKATSKAGAASSAPTDPCIRRAGGDICVRRRDPQIQVRRSNLRREILRFAQDDRLKKEHSLKAVPQRPRKVSRAWFEG